MSAIPVIAVFDIGKTNKKCFLIDESYRIVEERAAQLEEISDEDGDACENLIELDVFVRNTFREFHALPGYEIRALHCTAYGASFVHLDKESNVIAPLYNYLKPYPEGLQMQFYRDYDGEDLFSVRTASPVLGSLNSGMQLYRLRHLHPGLFGNISCSLHLPQYISFLFTGRPAADITSIGCHTALWDFAANTYHEWVEKEGIREKLPALSSCTGVSTVPYHGHVLKVGVGLHDSSAALIPYLSAFSEPFVLISTGTWCISLNPFNKTPLTVEELKQDCLCYLAYDGHPVKASRLFAGQEHEIQVRVLAEKFGVDIDSYRKVEFDPSCLDSSPFRARDHSSYAASYHAVMQDIIEKQKRSTSLIIGNVKRIFVDGGFANNPVYMHLLAAAFPRREVYAASVSQATAMGAALAIHAHWNNKPVPVDLVNLRFFAPHRR